MLSAGTFSIKMDRCKDDSRKYADMRRESLAVGIPSRLFKLFAD
jgi:hypothetical protein